MKTERLGRVASTPAAQLLQKNTNAQYGLHAVLDL
jgi:hypothetical protein